MEPTPIDPMLDEKANQLESEMHQQDTLIRSLIENLKHVERSQIPSITSSIQNIRNSLERILSSELPNAVKPVEDDVSRVKQKFEKFSSETQTKIQSFHEKLDDISISLQQSITRYNDLTSFTQTSVTNIETDLQHSKEALDNASKRLHLLESNLSKADSVLRSLKSDVQNLSKAFSDKLSQFVNECTNSFNNVSSRLNSALKSEAIVRSKSIYQVQQQIQEVIKNATDSTTKIQNFITTLRNQYQQVLTSLTRASKEGLTTCSTTYTNNFKEIDDRINQFISDSNKQFKQLESDISSTIQALHQYIITARQELETTISNISNSRINSETEIGTRFDPQIAHAIYLDMQDMFRYYPTLRAYNYRYPSGNAVLIQGPLTIKIGGYDAVLPLSMVLPDQFPFAPPFASISVPNGFHLSSSYALQPNGTINTNAVFKWVPRQSRLSQIVYAIQKFFSDYPPYSLQQAQSLSAQQPQQQQYQQSHAQPQQQYQQPQQQYQQPPSQPQQQYQQPPSQQQYQQPPSQQQYQQPPSQQQYQQPPSQPSSATMPPAQEPPHSIPGSGSAPLPPANAQPNTHEQQPANPAPPKAEPEKPAPAPEPAPEPKKDPEAEYKEKVKELREDFHNGKITAEQFTKTNRELSRTYFEKHLLPAFQ
ncbi:nuclear transcription factor Y subunit beta-like [Histomonas meleagridis]|uniref:nuclear transcription factor Y subunit beta-like n=1 Tax=Histomonas meleagridis TaxID=135588 RepID=UPI00355A247B|nr:nuclear transcription factor Y subunit beta-like [Histomonas meleagridis]KAH0800409.1 nuclear transcription factor Y subunit beta-like [Histomonas meleagridis]